MFRQTPLFYASIGKDCIKSYVSLQQIVAKQNRLYQNRRKCWFWNKRSSGGSQFLITAPSSLDNYFRSQQTRIKDVHLPIALQFNRLFCNESLHCILSKKLRGVKLSQPSQQFLQTPLTFIDKSTYDAFPITLSNLFHHYLLYKQHQLPKALLTDQLTTQIVKPFIRIYGAVSHHQYSIHSDEGRVQAELNKLFQQVLKQTQSGRCIHTGHQSQEELQKMWKSTTNVRVLEEANKMLRDVEENLLPSTRNIDDQKFKIRDFRTSHKKIESKIKISKPIPEVVAQVGNNVGKTSTSKTAKKIKFKTHENENEDEDQDNDDLCYELGLLISDTDRILKPMEDDVYSNTLSRMNSNVVRTPLSENNAS